MFPEDVCIVVDVVFSRAQHYWYRVSSTTRKGTDRRKFSNKGGNMVYANAAYAPSNWINFCLALYGVVSSELVF